MAPAVGVGRAVASAWAVRGIKLRHRAGVSSGVSSVAQAPDAAAGSRVAQERWHSSDVVVAVWAALAARVATGVAVVEAAEVEAGWKGSFVKAGQTAGRAMAGRW